MKQKSNYKKTWEDEFLENYKPPALLSNKYVWVASIVVGTQQRSGDKTYFRLNHDGVWRHLQHTNVAGLRLLLIIAASCTVL